VLTLDEALQIALVNNYVVRNTRLDLDNTSAQIREAWGQVLPQVNLQSNYTRNIKSANPFAGSEAGGLFSSFGLIDWLAFNEEARTDGDPSTEPISLTDFGERQREGLEAIGASFGGSDNPFSVPNEFTNGITVEQTLYSGSAFAAISAAARLMDINQRALERQEQIVIDEVRQGFYLALLMQEQMDVQQQSVARTAVTLNEVAKRVTQGVSPKFQRLSTEVELANLETQLVQARNQAAQSLDALKMQLGMPIDQPLRLRGELEAADPALFVNVSVESAFDVAFENRPDLEQARLAVELRKIDTKISRSEYLPTVNAFANFNYMGRVPDDRSFIQPSPDDPFTFSQGTNSFFSRNYWNPSIAAGIRLSWNLFDGFQTSARVQQKQVAVNKAEVDLDQTIELVRMEVNNAVRDLEAARRRIQSQDQNVANAELNYEYAQARLSEGVASQLEERNASEQLDLSRLNYLQAVHDYLVARSAFQTAIGRPLADGNLLQLTSK
jgi:outer membrane protein TolC